MKLRWLVWVLVLVSLAWVPGLQAQDEAARRAAAIAEKQEQEERTRRMESSIQDLLSAQAEQQKVINEQARQINALREELRRVRDDLVKAGAGAVTREDLKKITEAMSQLDERRVKDNKLLTEALEKLGNKLAMPEPPPVVVTPPKKAVTPPPPTNETGYWHVVESGQTLSVIVAAYREQGIKVTTKQVMDANPNVNWNRLSIGKKIFIPDPAKAKSEEK